MKGRFLLDGAMQMNSGRQSPEFSMRIEMPEVPKAFITRDKVKLVLCHTAEDFGYEEQQALYFYCFLNKPISEIAEKIGLSQSHVVSVLRLYSERLTNKLNLFKKALPYDADDVLPVSEILLQYDNSELA
ncbi:MAG: hypothetical protein FWC66_05025 [Oscillospiraceae bacterium]|nr:hypothetical protein [Oscillospiraceae bacterium]